MIVKPAADTPLSCFRFIAILREAGYPEAWAQALLTETRDVATKLVADRRVGFFSFIGSAAVGWKLRAQLAPGARCSLEHGGAAPVVVAEDADLDLAVKELGRSCFLNSGQVCLGTERVYVHESIYDEVADRLVEYAKNELKYGYPDDEATNSGPVVSDEHRDKVLS